MTLEPGIESREEMMQVLAYFIKENRERLGLAKENLAAMSSHDGSWLGKVESNKRKEISFFSVYRLVYAMNGKITFEFEE